LPGLLRQSDAMRINFDAQGEGVPLIILHGFLGSMDNWRAMSRRLAAHFRVYCLDLRNHGASPHSPIMDYAAMADDVHEFFINQNIDRANLLGHSMGGKVAMQFTADNPQAVTKLIVVDIVPKKYPPTHMPLLAALSALQLGNYRSYSDVDRDLQGQIPEAPVRQFLIKNLARGTDQTFHWRIGLDEIIANYDTLTQAVNIDAAIANPTLFIHAGRSGFVANIDIAAIRRVFPNAEIVTIANSGHWIHIDAADEFYEYVTGFLLDNNR
jgi:pimeloyl-ACP methyl ester carboxylesterase